jgi:hypothetical protein
MENKYFQWIAGDQRGQVKVFDRIEADGADVYIVFKDETRINETLVAPLNQKDMTGKFVAEVDSPNNVWSFKEKWVGREEERWETDAAGIKQLVVPFNPGKKVIELIPPKPTPKTSSAFGQISNSAPKAEQVPEPVIEEKSKIDKSDPVYIVLNTSKKFDSEINMGMIISLPPKNLYELAKDSFDEGDEKFIKYIVDEITVDEIKDALKLAIKEMYEESEKTGTGFSGVI